jgi:hypothetical protein
MHLRGSDSLNLDTSCVMIQPLGGCLLTSTSKESHTNIIFLLGLIPPHGGVLAAQHQPKKSNTYQPLIEVRIQRLRCLLGRYKTENPSHFGGCD